MSRRKASSAGTVSLFPFLAVLVCAMGALILLLLVTTRRIRQQSLVESTSLEQVDESADRALQTPAPFPDPDSAQSVPAVAAAAPRGAADAPLLPLLARDPAPQPHDPTPALMNELATLEARQATLAAEVAQREQQLDRLATTSTAHSEKLAEQRTAAAEHAAEKERLNNLYLRLRRQQDETEQRAEDLRKQIQQTRVQVAEADSKFAIIPYDGHSGTARRPIIIECTADRLTFVSEGITLQATDLDGFPPRYNPLLYVTQALVRYWERQQRSDADIGKPYVMLVVRPGGTTGYYVARGLLGPMGESFGYELVTDDQQFAWPPSDAEATAICRTIIEKMLAERDAMLEVALRGGAQLGQYSNGRGEFELAEIERLKNPTREVTINGQKYSREPQTFGSLSRDADARSTEGATTGRSRFDGDASGRGEAQAGRLSARDRSSESDGLREMGALTGDSIDEAAPRGVYTQQNSAITQEDRMTEWLREGTTRLETPHQGDSSRISDIDPFADLAESSSPISPHDPAGEPHPKGQERFFDADATATGEPSQDRPAPQRLDFARSGAGEGSPIEESRPQWGPRSGSGLIGFEKQVRIDVTATQISIGDQYTYQVDTSTSIGDLRRLLAGSINREVRGWGSPPRSFYWVPAIRFAVAPDGRLQHERLRKIIKEWDLQSTAEYLNE
jgi:hypothetical protein